MVTTLFVTNTNLIENGKINQPMSLNKELLDNNKNEVSLATTQNTTNNKEDLDNKEIAATLPGSLT